MIFKCMFRTFKYKVLPYGLRSAPSQFQRVLEHVLKEEANINVLVYLDDIHKATETEEHYFVVLKRVLKKLKNFNFHCKRENVFLTV
jgi:Reverse transcriptase (RNA-dependent DNA polymerase)